MAIANINAFYAGSLRIKIAYFVSELFYIYKWCVTKVAHCIFIMYGFVQCCSFPWYMYIVCDKGRIQDFWKWGSYIEGVRFADFI